MALDHLIRLGSATAEHLRVFFDTLSHRAPGHRRERGPAQRRHDALLELVARARCHRLMRVEDRPALVGQRVLGPIPRPFGG